MSDKWPPLKVYVHQSECSLRYKRFQFLAALEALPLSLFLPLSPLTFSLSHPSLSKKKQRTPSLPLATQNPLPMGYATRNGTCSGSTESPRHTLRNEPLVFKFLWRFIFWFWMQKNRELLFLFFLFVHLCACATSVCLWIMQCNDARACAYFLPMLLH